MKKRSLLVTLILSLALLLSACGENSPFVGTWRGTCDLTDFIVSEMVAGDPALEEYAKFEDLEFVIMFEFTEDEVTLSVDETSLEQFVANAEKGMGDMLDAYVKDIAESQSVAPEDVYTAMGISREEMVDSMGLDTMMDTMAEALELSGTYTNDEEVITVYYEDGKYEEMEYAFEGETLTITVTDGETSFDIVCEKE